MKQSNHPHSIVSWVNLVRFGGFSWSSKTWTTLRRTNIIFQMCKEGRNLPKQWRNTFKQTQTWKSWMKLRVMVYL